ncbi:hypothetical protein HN865_03640 [Candidatus Woesearchaeota archaeon]|jgi:hypothetical protein|nr:hypothetical protein [Cryomorphaceae bacterium]MBT6995769.1 hypothetical protein [Candidatus Woesearchaeota archaeon]MBT7237924.1 hypothetical protein [Candidatus Woesearchaeota archaeon]
MKYRSPNLEMLLENRILNNTSIASRYFFEEGFVPFLSNVELTGIVTKLKNSMLHESGEMQKIGVEAELYFREILSKKNKSIFEIYLDLKEGRITGNKAKKIWSEISPKLGDYEIKNKYIQSKITPTIEDDRKLFEKAIEGIVRKRTENSFDKYDSKTQLRKLSKLQIDRFVETAEFIRTNSTDILYENGLHDIFLDSIKGNEKINFLYCVCLRFTHDEGIPDISEHLDPLIKIDKNGNFQKHTGEAQRYQLEKIIEISKFIGNNFPNINQEVMIADFDVHKYGVDSSKIMFPKSKNYLDSVSNFIEGIPVTGEMDYMAGIGFDPDLFKKIYLSLLINDGSFFPKEDMTRELENCEKHRSRSINNWTKNNSIHYVASSLARKLSEGITMSESPINHVVMLFNDNAVPGTRFNYLTNKKLPFISLPKLGRPIDDYLYY